MDTRTAEFLAASGCRRAPPSSNSSLIPTTSPPESWGPPLAQFELFGIRRTTMEDVARRKRTGPGRPLYRRFANKDLLVDAIVHTEVLRYLEGNALAPRTWADIRGPNRRGHRPSRCSFLRHHALLNKLMDTEPETILPSFTVDGAAIIDLGARTICSDDAHRVVRRHESVTNPGTPPSNSRRTPHQTDLVVHPHPTQQHQP